MNKKLLGYMFAAALSIGTASLAIPALASEADTETEISSVQEKKASRFGRLDEETLAKIKEIREQVKAGTLTKEEAQNQLNELGITKPEKDITANQDKL